MEQQGLIYTNESCVSCNKCVRVCTAPGASYLQLSGGTSSVHINAQRCVACGACFALCEHHARSYRDDTEAFFEDLKAGEPISVLLAPSFKASYPKEYAAILGGLKALGVRRIVNVAFGADICTWAYLKYMRQEQSYGAISTPCPVAVSYVEHYLPELIPMLVPVQSPMGCAAVYCREELGITDRLAFIGPCIGKKLETEAYGQSPVRYNVTFLRLMEYVRSHQLFGPDASDEVEYGLGSFYPAPGGLADNIRWFLGDDAQIRVISGKTYLYGWLKKNAAHLLHHETPFRLIDVLNCQNGCVEGTAGEEKRFEEDGALYTLGGIRTASKSADAASPWNAALTPQERLEKLNQQFQHLSLSHYLRTFADRSAGCQIRYPSEEEANAIFLEMHKHTEKSRTINCSTCGYGSCRDLMVAIYNGFNHKRSCIHYEKEETLRVERLSFCDQLTLVMNRNALERRKASLMPMEKSVAILVADVNGLKEANDVYGHEAGDQLIVNVASCLADVFGRENVFRTGGDEFLVLLLDHLEEECKNGIAQVQDALSQLHVSASIGYAFRPRFDTDFTELQRLADQDMYEKKRAHYQALGKTPRSGG